MKISPFYFLVLSSWLYIPAVAQEQLQKIYLNPKTAANGKQSQFVDSVRFIPFEFADGINMGTSSQLTLTNKYFLIIEYNEKRVLIYSKEGKFIKKVDYKSLGEGFYPDYDPYINQLVFFGKNKNYTLTPKDEVKIMLDWSNPRNKKYFKKYTISLNDTLFVRKKVAPTENDIIYAYHFFDDFYWQGRITTSPLFKDTLDYEFKIYRGNKLAKAFFPYNHIKEPKFLFANESTAVNPTDSPNIHFITRPYYDTIYKMRRDSMFPAYQLVLPLENSLPQSFFTKSFKNKTERENFQRNNAWMFHQVYFFIETPKLILFRVSYLNNSESYVYQKETNLTYKTKNIKPDISQYNLELLTGYSILRKGDRFYKSQKAGDLLAFFEKNKNVPIPAELESFLKSNPPATTPVIVEFKLKN